MTDIEDALKQIEQYRRMREQMEEFTPIAHKAIRKAKAGGKTKAFLHRASGISRPWIDKILDER